MGGQGQTTRSKVFTKQRSHLPSRRAIKQNHTKKPAKTPLVFKSEQTKESREG